MVLTGLLALLVRSPLPACGQTALAGAASAERLHGQVVQEIDDAATGDRWVLVRDAMNPAGPGRMVRIASSGWIQGQAAQKDGRSRTSPPLCPVIHAGDAVIVEEHTAVVDARLEAVALGPAVVGAAFRARLKIGGKVVRVVARAAGRAEMMPESEAQP